MNIKTLAAVAALTLTATPAGAHHVTRADLDRMVVEVFGPAAPTFRRIIACESSWNHRAVGRNRNGTIDVGLTQINSSNFPALGLTAASAKDPMTNLRAAKRLYDQAGVKPWVCSRRWR